MFSSCDCSSISWRIYLPLQFTQNKCHFISVLLSSLNTPIADPNDVQGMVGSRFKIEILVDYKISILGLSETFTCKSIDN